ncbi:SGNH/GDSL hydrolase family protein [Nocardioides sp. SYSU DS0651]|uniref:SGNH/GDSL hydrolase family protein n=1 Tax=Nocardioides sp. SYSU DS0651 TaxID=3415955 RepID=UPI003F4C6341
MGRPGHGLLSLALGGVLLSGCSSPVDARANRAEPVEEGQQYVALGDSFTAAPFVGEQTGPGVCTRTDANYPHLLATRLDLELVDVSCGGATSEDLTEPQFDGGDGVPPQLDALTEDTDLVTVSIGANDDDLFASLIVNCVRAGMNNPGGASCTRLARHDNGRITEQLDDIADQTVDNVGAILDRAPRARVVVVGYPQLVPASGTCPELPVAEADYPFVREVNERLAAALEEGAAEAGAEYVDMWSLSKGHDICAEEPWVAGLRPVRGAAPFHPYAEHQVAVADALERLLAEQGRN